MESTTLFGITKEYKDIMNVLEENGGEITEEIENMLEKINESMVDKMEKYSNVIRHYNDIVDSIKKEKNRLDGLKKTAENCIELLKKRIIDAMKECDFEKINFNTGGYVRVGKSKFVDIIDETLIPEKYFQVKKEIQKKMIGDDIKNNIKVPGAVINERDTLTIK